MRTIPTIITSGEFTGSGPYGYLAKDASGPTLLDGTEYNAASIDDFNWGWIQAAMKQAGITPDGNPETEDASQILDALARIMSPVGSVFEWNRADDPATANARVLYVHGQGISRSAYPDLDAACYVGSVRNPTASGFYRANDSGGVDRNINGGYLILPDYRGYFPRCIGGVDPVPGRSLFDIQGDMFQGHGHWTNAWGRTDVSITSGTGKAANDSSTAVVTTPTNDGTNGTPRIGIETRPKNRATKYVVRY